MSKTLKSVRGKKNSKEKSAHKIVSSPATTLKKLFKTPSRRNLSGGGGGADDSSPIPSIPLVDLAEGDEEAHKERERLEEERERLQQEIQNDTNVTELPSPEETMLKKVEGLVAIAPPNLLLSDDEDELPDIPLDVLEEDQGGADQEEKTTTDEEVGEGSLIEEEESVPTKSEEDNNEEEDECEDDSDRRSSISASPKSPGRRKKKKSSKRRRKKKKAVSFGEGVLVYTDTRGARERQAMFYSEQEMDDFRQDVAYHASVLMSNNPDNGDYVQQQSVGAVHLPQHEGNNKSDDSDLCLLGVEHHFLNETYKQKQKLKAILAVLMEQDRQYKEDGHFTPSDDVEMSKCYQRVSRISHKEAHERGMRSLMRDGGEGQNGGGAGDTEPSSSTSSLYAPASPMSVAGE